MGASKLQTSVPGESMKERWLLLMVLTLGGICSMASAQKASVILVNGKVWTENPAQPVAEAVALGQANSPAELKEHVAEFVKTLPKGAWIRNGVWDHQRWIPPVLPNHQVI